MIGPFELNRAHCGDATEMLRRLPDESVQCCVTSPPYWGLRNYGVAGQIGMEQTPQEYVVRMTSVFEEVRRVLRDDGILWINLGDSYASGKGTCFNPGGGENSLGRDRKEQGVHPLNRGNKSDLCIAGLKPKDLVGIPWRLAFALQAAGWYLRCDVIWSKPNPMPESVMDRPTKSHEYLFLMAKSEQYFYDAAAIRENVVSDSDWEYRQRLRQTRTYDVKGPYKDNFPGGRKKKVPAGWHQGTRGDELAKAKGEKQRGHSRRHDGFNDRWDSMTKEEQQAGGRNKRSVWEIATMPYTGAHFATFPAALVEPCILAGSRPGDVVLDPFSGSGTTGMVAIQHDRKFIGFDLNPEYCQKLAAPRLAAAERHQTVEQYEAGQLTIDDMIGALGDCMKSKGEGNG